MQWCRSENIHYTDLSSLLLALPSLGGKTNNDSRKIWNFSWWWWWWWWGGWALRGWEGWGANVELSPKATVAMTPAAARNPNMARVRRIRTLLTKNAQLLHKGIFHGLREPDIRCSRNNDMEILIWSCNGSWDSILMKSFEFIVYHCMHFIAWWPLSNGWIDPPLVGYSNMGSISGAGGRSDWYCQFHLLKHIIQQMESSYTSRIKQNHNNSA